MKDKRKFRITEADFMLANRRAARQEDIRNHGQPTTFRGALHRSRKAYDRNEIKRKPLDDED